MKRNIITIEGKSVIVTGNDVWMMAWEIGELFNVATTYSLEIIIPIAFRLNTYYTHVFRSWLLRKAYAKEQKDTYMLFVPIAKGGHC